MIKLAAIVSTGVIGYGVWALMAYYDPTLRQDFLKFNIAMASGAAALALRDMKGPP